jgi:nucleoside-diphosphate-sugar epimerase
MHLGMFALHCSVAISDSQSMTTAAVARPIVALSGASGFIGRALASSLQRRFHVRGLGRGDGPTTDSHVESWIQTDLFNLRQAEAALAGATIAIYLVHSMMPTARLTQAAFEDLDLLCADNFGRAAAKAGVKQIVYLGGLIPSDGQLSTHLQSRNEVANALGSYGTPVTTLRAGLILGGGGSSFEMLVKLVERLPAMICPGWTKTRTQPIAVDDVVTLMDFATGNANCYGQTYDIGAPDVVTYRDLLEMVAQELGVKRRMIAVPFFSPSLSRLWISTVSGASSELVGPLVQSLKHEMVARDDRLATSAGFATTPVRRAIALALQARKSNIASRATDTRPTTNKPASARLSLVRSVQRMMLPVDRDAVWAAHEYTSWLPHAFWRLLRVDVDDKRECRFCLLGMKTPLLVLTYSAERSSAGRELFFVTGGLLSRADQRGRFELREVSGTRTLLTAIHDFAPRLPWFIYRYTQAVFHGWVMAAFRRHIAKVAA